MTVPHVPHARGSAVFATTTIALLVGLGICALLAGLAQPAAEARRGETRTMASALGLTDLALLGEARYTRHPSQADLASAFQDGPAVLDHFPAASLVAPPRDFGVGRFVVGEPRP